MIDEYEVCIHGFERFLNCGYCGFIDSCGKDFFNWKKFPKGIPRKKCWEEYIITRKNNKK